MGFVLAAESPLSDDARAMIARLDARMAELYVVDACHLIAPEALAQREAVFLVAREEGAALGCGALVLHDGAGGPWGELKRVWTERHARGRGIARAITRALEAEARARGLSGLHLETGVHQPEAQALYHSEGFVIGGPYADLPDHPDSVFMHKTLAAPASAAARASA